MELIAKRRALLIGTNIFQALEGYQKVQYIQSSTTQYIKSGVYDGNPRLQISATFSNIGGTGYRYIIGCWSNDEQNNTVIYVQPSGRLGCWVDRGFSLNAMIKASIAEKHTVLVDHENYYLDGELVCRNFYAAESRPGAELYIFRRNGANGTPAQGASTPSKIYGLSIADNGTVIRDFIPCYRKSDNKPGFFDLCGSICPATNSPFYTNAGTGEFFIGPEIN